MPEQVEDTLAELKTLNAQTKTAMEKGDGAAKCALIGAALAGVGLRFADVTLAPGVAIVGVGLVVGAAIGWLAGGWLSEPNSPDAASGEQQN